jgi:hypothetical protein
MKIPNEPHYAIITSDSIMIPGDERSRTNPGHGYPEHTVESISYMTFKDQDDLLAYLQRMGDSARSRAVVIHAKPLSVKTTAI